MLSYLVENASFFLIALVTLFIYALVDLFIGLPLTLKSFRFLSRKHFWVYFCVIAFFSIATMEVGYLLNLFTTESKHAVAFFAPLVFAVVLQNLVVKIGGVDKSIDFAEFFDKFKFAIQQSLIRKEEITKVQIQADLMKSKVSTQDIIDWVRFYSKTDKEWETLVNKIAKMTEKGQRIEAIKYLVNLAKDVEIAEKLSS